MKKSQLYSFVKENKHILSFKCLTKVNISHYNLLIQYSLFIYTKEGIGMLVGFSVSNYKSFKQTQKISFEASKVIRHKNHVTIKNNKRILKSGLIFGANAGGKSNLVKAIRFSREIILNGLDRVNLSKSHFGLKMKCTDSRVCLSIGL